LKGLKRCNISAERERSNIHLELSKIDSKVTSMFLKVDYLIRIETDYNFERFDMPSKHGDTDFKKFTLKCVSNKPKIKIN